MRARKAEQGVLVESYANAFGFSAQHSVEYIAEVGLENFRIALSGGRAVAVMAVIQTAHWLGGCPVDSINIAHVAVDPVFRGAGLAGVFLDAVCEEARQGGATLATLFASTRPVYRRSGFALAGSEIIYEAETAAMPRVRGASFRRVSRNSALETIGPMYDRRCETDTGLLKRADAHWNHLLAGEPAIYVSTTNDAEGYLVLNTSDANCLVIRDWAALGTKAAAHLLTLIGTFSSVYSRVRWHGSSHDLLIYELPDKGWKLQHQEEWLARVLDPVAALEQRGYLADRSVSIDLVSVEEELKLTLSVCGGRGVCTPGSGTSSKVRLGIADFGTLITGHRSASFLARAGVLTGDPEAISACDTLFSGPPPWVGEHF